MRAEEFEQVAQELRALALGVARGFQCPTDEAEDAVQDSLIRLWQLKHEVATVADARRLIVVVMRHTLTDQWRQQQSRRTLPLPEHSLTASTDALPDEALEQRETEAWIKSRLAALPHTEYQVLRLRQEEQLDNEQIAALLGITAASVATLLSRARQRLLREIKNRKNRPL